MSPEPSVENDFPVDAVSQLLHAAGFDGEWQVHRLGRGRNNRSYQIAVGRDRLFLKWYFVHPADHRNRMQAEFTFSNFVWANGIRCIAQPLACDAQAQLSLFVFFDGRRLTIDDLNQGALNQSLKFFCDINQFRQRPQAVNLADASEACFSIADHVACVHKRVEGLSVLAGNDDIDREVIEFIHTKLAPAFSHVRDQIFGVSGRRGEDRRRLRSENRCLSPSDFGFHNALQSDDGQIFFCDFEYAGWDDPAKTICDFFAQVELPVPSGWLGPFTEGVSSCVANGADLRLRVLRLMPLYQIKWCCILLNEFFPIARQRREFSGGQTDVRREQLSKAQAKLSLIGTSNT